MDRRIIIAIIAVIGGVLATYLIANAVINRNEDTRTITVTGLGSKEFTSDLVVWNGRFARQDKDLKQAYETLERDRKVVEGYLLSQGLKKEEIVFSAGGISRNYQSERDDEGHYSQRFMGFVLEQSVSLESKDIAKIEAVSRNISEIINQGIEFTSLSPRYYYTRLAELKHEIIAKATEDARIRAEKIAQNSGGRLGRLTKATTGIIQITAPYSDEEYSYGGTFNTSSKEKVASITIKLEYKVR